MTDPNRCSILFSKFLKHRKLLCNNSLITVILAIIFIALYVRYGLSIASIKGVILFLILIYASINDILYRKVDDFIWVEVLILAFIGIDIEMIPLMFIGALTVFLTMLVVNIQNPSKAIGGADIKITASLVFMLGFEKGILVVIIGLAAAVVFMMIANRLRNVSKSGSFPLVPFIAVSAMGGYLC